jgi:hypothetical protein
MVVHHSAGIAGPSHRFTINEFRTHDLPTQDRTSARRINRISARSIPHGSKDQPQIWVSGLTTVACAAIAYGAMRASPVCAGDGGLTDLCSAKEKGTTEDVIGDVLAG